MPLELSDARLRYVPLNCICSDQFWRTIIFLLSALMYKCENKFGQMMIVQFPKVWVTCTQTKWKITLASFWEQLSCTHTEWQPRQRVTSREEYYKLWFPQSTTYKYTTCYNQLNHLEIRSKNPRSEQCRALWSWSHEVVLEKPLTLPPFYFPLPALHIQLLLPLIVVVPLCIVHILNIREYAG